MKTYRINCIEHGEKFYVILNSSATGEELKDQAYREAQGWGAEVISIEETEFDPLAWNCDLTNKENLQAAINRGELPPLPGMPKEEQC